MLAGGHRGLIGCSLRRKRRGRRALRIACGAADAGREVVCCRCGRANGAGIGGRRCRCQCWRCTAGLQGQQVFLQSSAACKQGCRRIVGRRGSGARNSGHGGVGGTLPFFLGSSQTHCASLLQLLLPLSFFCLLCLRSQAGKLLLLNFAELAAFAFALQGENLLAQVL